MIVIRGTYLATVFFSLLFIIVGHRVAIDGLYAFHDETQEVVRARVQGVTDRTSPYDEYGDYIPMLGERIVFEARVTSGSHRGETLTAVQGFSVLTTGRTKEVSRGDSVLLVFLNGEWNFSGFLRLNRLLGLGIVFILCVLFFGGKKGFNTILSLGFTCTAIFAVFIPSVLSGKNIYVMSLLVCAYTSTMVPLIVMGYNKKSLAAITGCAAGIVIAGIVSLVMDRVLNLTGIVDEHSRYLVYLPGDIHINLNAIIFAGIIIGAMGAIMDVSISISSALWEIKEKAETITFKDLFRSGINIGRDIMGTMADTLILAYIGSSLSLVLLLSVYSDSLMSLFNSEMIAVEILQALAGSFGILFAMPLTALFCAIFYLKDNNG